MKELDILKSIEKCVKDAKLDASLFLPTEKIPYESLAVFIGSDSQNEPLVLNITAQNQILDPKKVSSLFRVQFRVKLPFKIAGFSLSQTSNLIALINHFADLPGFEINELENEVYFRHVLMLEKKGLSDQLILGLIGLIKFIVETQSPAIEGVATGKLSYDELLTNALKVTA